jgi:hypothetical protein
MYPFFGHSAFGPLESICILQVFRSRLDSSEVTIKCRLPLNVILLSCSVLSS